MDENLQTEKNHVRPISASQRHDVRLRTHCLLREAEQAYNILFSQPDIRFTLNGQRAGLYAWRRNGDCYINYNPYVFAIDLEHHLQDTVAHEVAHHVALQLHGQRIKPHGREWQRIAKLLGATPTARGDYSLDGVPVRRQRRYEYRCQCQTWPVSATRHNRIQQQGIIYHCKACRRPLQYKSDDK